MTSINIRYFVDEAIKDSNQASNDYQYRSGWNPSMVLGQQYEIWKPEAQELVASIEREAWFSDPMLPGSAPMDLRAATLQALQELTTPAAAEGMSKGSVGLSHNAARVLNAYAKELGANIKFSPHQPKPNHPVG